jgi:hypothetical protein
MIQKMTQKEWMATKWSELIHSARTETKKQYWFR